MIIDFNFLIEIIVSFLAKANIELMLDDNEELLSTRTHIMTNETSRLLPVDPIPVDITTVERDLIVDRKLANNFRERINRYYYLILLVCGFILILLSGIYEINKVIKGVSLNINNVEFLDLSDSSVMLDIEGIQLDFQDTGLFKWLNVINNKTLYFSKDLKIYDGENHPVLIANVSSRKYDINLSNSSWTFDLNNLSIEIEGDKFSKLVNDISNTSNSRYRIETKIYVNNIPISINKKLSFTNHQIIGLVDRMSNKILGDVYIKNLIIDPYEKNLGFQGQVDISIPKILKIWKGKKIDLNSDIGLMIENQFKKILNINTDKRKIYGNYLSLNFILYNIDEKIIESGIVDEIVWRVLNDDSKLKALSICILGNHSSGKSWFEKFMLNINMSLNLYVHNLGKKILEAMEVNNIVNKEITLNNLEVNSNKKHGNVEIGTDLSIVSKSFKKIFNFTSRTSGEIGIEGIDLVFNNGYIENKNGIIETNLRDIFFNIENINQSIDFFQTIINRNGIDVLNKLNFKTHSNIESKFFKGILNLNSSVDISYKTINDLFPKLEEGMVNNMIELNGINFVNEGSNFIETKVQTNIKLPKFIKKIENNFEKVNLITKYKSTELITIGIDRFKNEEEESCYVDIDLKLDISDLEKKRIIEEFIGGFISGISNNITISGYSNNEEKSIYGVNKNIDEFINGISIPLNVSTNDIDGGNEGDNYFIKNTIMHIVSKEVEMTLYNPIKNRNIIVEIEEAEAKCEGYIIGYLKDKITWNIESGIWNSPREKVEYANTGSAGWKIIERAIRGDGVLKDMTVRAVIKVYVDGSEFKGLNLMYQSVGTVNGKVRW